jgi:hypothetical protein
MAYMTNIVSKCGYGGCAARATVRVYNTFNSSCGEFCRKHGAKRVAELERAEPAMVRATIAERERR